MEKKVIVVLLFGLFCVSCAQDEGKLNNFFYNRYRDFLYYSRWRFKILISRKLYYRFALKKSKFGSIKLWRV